MVVYPGNNEEVRRQLAGNILLAFATLYSPESTKKVFWLIDSSSLELKRRFLEKQSIDTIVEDPKNKPN